MNICQRKIYVLVVSNPESLLLLLGELLHEFSEFSFGRNFYVLWNLARVLCDFVEDFV